MTPIESGFYHVLRALLEEPTDSQRYDDAKHVVMAWSSYGWLCAIDIYRREKNG